MKNRITLSLITLIFLGSCSQNMPHTWTVEGFEGKHFENILIVGITPNLEARSTFESMVVKYFSKEGINATNSLVVFPPIVDIKDLPEEEVEKRILEGGFDGVLVTSVIDASTKDVYEQGSMSAAYYPSRYGYGYRGYIYSGYNTMYSPGYHREQKSYVVESRLYAIDDSATEDDIVWGGQSTIIDPSSSTSFSKQYAKKLIATLKMSGTLK